MRYVDLGRGDQMPVLGQGTWHMGERGKDRDEEIAALRHGVELGLGLIDTAEMYGNGGAEKIVGTAIAGRRDETFLVSKVLPQHASARGTIDACERSLARMGTDRLDLYLLHWRANIPLAETVEAFERLRSDGKIRHFGVSNFDIDDMTELWSSQSSARNTATNQVLYNLSRRGPEVDLLPWCREHRVPVMAYSPIEQGRLLGSSALRRVADRHNATGAQIAIAWVLHQPQVSAIPKAATREHVEENRAAIDIELTADDLAELDREFPPQVEPTPLEIL